VLYVLPLVFALIGLALYGVLAGADFGAGFWQLTAGRGPDADALRQRAHESMGPVWEANHVWLIFVLTVVWTAYPKAFGSIASTLSVALLIAAVGIILRGAAYALRSGADEPRQQRRIDTVFGISSVIAPFALGAAAGAVASGRVPVGNARGGAVSSWLNPTSVLIGTLAVVTGVYLAAVFLSGDAARDGERDLSERFRIRALGSGAVAGVVAIGGFVVLHADAHALYRGLVTGGGLAALIVSVLAGLGTLALVWTRRYERARFTAALAVAAIVAGWALAQNPRLLPGLTVRQAAAPHDTLVAVVVAVVAGGALLAPSLGTLFWLALGGRFGHGAGAGASPGAAITAAVHTARSTDHPGWLVRVAAALFVAGLGFTNVADANWAHLVGAACYLGFLATAFRVALPSLA
jgi:cytochrome d ubiquinol oxidase subunit II